jgi:hypothetical protein
MRCHGWLVCRGRSRPRCWLIRAATCRRTHANNPTGRFALSGTASRVPATRPTPTTNHTTSMALTVTASMTQCAYWSAEAVVERYPFREPHDPSGGAARCGIAATLCLVATQPSVARAAGRIRVIRKRLRRERRLLTPTQRTEGCLARVLGKATAQTISVQKSAQQQIVTQQNAPP